MADVHALPQLTPNITGRPDQSEIRFRGGGFVVKSHKRGVGIIGFVVLLGLWEVSVRAGWINPVFLPSVTDVMAALWRLVVSGDLWVHLRASLMRLALGWSLGTSLGILLGFCIGVWSLAR